MAKNKTKKTPRIGKGDATFSFPPLGIILKPEGRDELVKGWLEKHRQKKW